MNYCQVRPSAAVARFVEFYWMLEDRSSASGVQRIVPDGRSGIILNWDHPFESHTGAVWKVQPECFFVGQITGPLLLRPSGPAAMLGIQFRPHGATQLLRLPMSALTDSAIPLDALSRPLFRELDRLRQLPSLAHALAALDPILHTFAEQSRIDDNLVAYAVRDIEHTGGLFGRMQRFQRVFRDMEAPGSDWVNAAVHCGYYDQAHLIRDCREFSGKTPTSLLDREIDLSRQFVKTLAMSHFSKTARDKSR